MTLSEKTKKIFMELDEKKKKNEVSIIVTKDLRLRLERKNNRENITKDLRLRLERKNITKNLRLRLELENTRGNIIKDQRLRLEE